jgi:hypothetical protein
LPTATEPVKLSLRMTPEPSAVRDTRSGAPNSRFTTPAGKPTSCSTCTSSAAVAGVSSAGLMTTVQPAASASAILRAGKISGMFQGQAANTGPMGWRSVNWRV